MADRLADWKEPEQTEAERRAAFVERMTDNEGIIVVKPGEPLPPMPPGPRGEGHADSHEYRMSEGVILRHSGARGLRDLEAWNERDRVWFSYPDILEDWIEHSRPIPGDRVSDIARAAPSVWREVRDENGQLLGWTRDAAGKTLLTVAADAAMARIEAEIEALYSAASRASHRGVK